ncbi:hypothetical protein KIN20_029519 [Parelaphostrongylus tenuis]|uniref:Uncharacterized protein n=1 Tax=Parelaphostrongylus tenuis TaxID=148309 RepID=A0AAD5R2K8_PARTN|nr:hypothetical protein KIN20_029519 [Parelaphostrongylus tenuis]
MDGCRTTKGRMEYVLESAQLVKTERPSIQVQDKVALEANFAPHLPRITRCAAA